MPQFHPFLLINTCVSGFERISCHTWVLTITGYSCGLVVYNSGYMQFQFQRNCSFWIQIACLHKTGTDVLRVVSCMVQFWLRLLVQLASNAKIDFHCLLILHATRVTTQWFTQPISSVARMSKLRGHSMGTLLHLLGDLGHAPAMKHFKNHTPWDHFWGCFRLQTPFFRLTCMLASWNLRSDMPVTDLWP